MLNNWNLVPLAEITRNTAPTESETSSVRAVLNPEEEWCGYNCGFELSPDDFLSDNELQDQLNVTHFIGEEKENSAMMQISHECSSIRSEFNMAPVKGLPEAFNISKSTFVSSKNSQL
jgi:hypothetical protein